MLWSDYLSSPNSSVKILTPKGDSIRRWGLWEVKGHESEALMNGISALIKKTLGCSLDSSTM